MKKITKATYKSFIKNNMDNLFIDVRSSFDGMIDGLNWDKDHGFKKVEVTEDNVDHTMGIRFSWLVGRGGDRFSAYDDGTFQGIAVVNCCGYFTVAIKK